jgi:hypothetical protein
MITLSEAVDSPIGKKLYDKDFLNRRGLMESTHTFLGIYILQERAKKPQHREWWINQFLNMLPSDCNDFPVFYT